MGQTISLAGALKHGIYLLSHATATNPHTERLRCLHAPRSRHKSHDRTSRPAQVCADACPQPERQTTTCCVHTSLDHKRQHRRLLVNFSFCWPWTRCSGSSSMGELSFQPQNVVAHLIHLILPVGTEIGMSQLLQHSTPPCEPHEIPCACPPEHAFPLAIDQ
jgi:hypothetical protein